MPGTIVDRLRGLAALAARNPDLAGVTVGSALGSCLTWYGPHREALRRRLRVEPLDERFLWLTVDGYGLAWPRGASIGRLVTALIEIRAPDNPHYYFNDETRVRPGDAVLDIGACEGAFAIECLLRHGAARATCFEPDPLMARALRLSAARNGIEARMPVVEAAVSDASGSAAFAQDALDPLASHVVAWTADAGALSGSTIAVATLTLDDWMRRSGAERVDFIKIDAEGADLAALEGGRELLARWRPDLAVTTYHQAEHAREMVRTLTALGLGYRIRVRGLNVIDSRARPMMLLAHAPQRPART